MSDEVKFIRKVVVAYLRFVPTICVDRLIRTSVRDSNQVHKNARDKHYRLG